MGSFWRLALFLCVFAFASAQNYDDYHKYRRDTLKWKQVYDEEMENQRAELKHHPDLVQIHYPLDFMIPTDDYVIKDQTYYYSEILIDPCKGKEFNCCNDTFGSPQYTVEENGVLIDVDTNGDPIADINNRRADMQHIEDSTCFGPGNPDIFCVAKDVRAVEFDVLPPCWDHNTTVRALDSCRTAHGSVRAHCFEVGYSQSAYVVQCGGKYTYHPHCGTYLEIHVPGEHEVISEVRLVSQYTSGFRKTYLGTAFKENKDLVMCTGDYEIWWVQRTRYDFQVERIKKFAVLEPECDWDIVNEKNFPYHRLTEEEKAERDVLEAEADLLLAEQALEEYEAKMIMSASAEDEYYVEIINVYDQYGQLIATTTADELEATAAAEAAAEGKE